MLMLIVLPWVALAQPSERPSRAAEVRLALVPAHPDKPEGTPSAAWLEPVDRSRDLSFVPKGHYTLLQKNRVFVPHLQVIPVGSVVAFPNADPFFHNVFSLFDGKRFDLGLYEAGSSKSVTFSHEGVSYIFCNIHPEMSAVIIALSTPLYAIADPNGMVVIRNVPPGDYRLHAWMEGAPTSVLSSLGRSVHAAGATVNLGRLVVPNQPGMMHHSNEYGKPYKAEPDSIY